MRTRTAALAAAVLGVSGLLTLPTAATAVAATHPLGPQHTARSHPRLPGFNQDGGNWSGYVATGSGFSSVSASWTEPAVTCNSTKDLFAPWVGIDGYGSSTVEQTGVATDCSGGRPVYQGWYEMFPAAPVYYSNPVSAGDVINASVTRSGSTYTLTLTDSTKGWTQTVNKSLQARNVSAEVIVESPTSAYPNFGKVTFSSATINGGSLSNYSPVALDASNDSGFEDQTGSLSGGNFSIAYLRE